jgi:hypothetical protein
MKQPARALIGYMSLDEATRLLSGGSAEDTDSSEKYESVWRQHRAAALQRLAYVQEDPRVPIPPQLEERLRAFAQREDIRTAMLPLEWTVGFVDLSKSVLTFQKVILTGNADQRVEAADPDSPASLLSICIPDSRTAQFQGAFDPALLAFTASSMNPNLRLAGFEVATSPPASGAAGQQVFGFRLSFGASFVQVAEYQGRWMVRDGYHRVYGLMKRGVTQIPCIIVQARNFSETGAGRPGFFDYETLYRENPPRIADFFTDAAIDVEVPATMKVVRIRAEEFVVPITDPSESAL